MFAIAIVIMGLILAAMFFSFLVSLVFGAASSATGSSFEDAFMNAGSAMGDAFTMGLMSFVFVPICYAIFGDSHLDNYPVLETILWITGGTFVVSLIGGSSGSKKKEDE